MSSFSPEAEANALTVIHELSESRIAELHILYQNEWWTRGRSLEATRNCVAGSQICIGLVSGTHSLIGFARVLTDFTFKALIFDVIVNPDYRGLGLGDRLVSLIVSHPRLKSVASFELYCLPELIPFYERHGFGDDVGGIRLMRRTNPQQ